MAESGVPELYLQDGSDDFLSGVFRFQLAAGSRSREQASILPIDQRFRGIVTALQA